MFANLQGGSSKVASARISSSEKGGSTGDSNQVKFHDGGGLASRKDYNYFTINSNGNGKVIMIIRSLSGRFYAKRR